MERDYIIKKRVRGSSIADALKRSNTGRIIEVYEDVKTESMPSNPIPGFKKTKKHAKPNRRN